MCFHKPEADGNTPLEKLVTKLRKIFEAVVVVELDLAVWITASRRRPFNRMIDASPQHDCVSTSGWVQDVGHICWLVSRTSCHTRRLYIMCFSGPNAESLSSQCADRVDSVVQYRKLMDPSALVGDVFQLTELEQARALRIDDAKARHMSVFICCARIVTMWPFGLEFRRSSRLAAGMRFLFGVVPWCKMAMAG